MASFVQQHPAHNYLDGPAPLAPRRTEEFVFRLPGLWMAGLTKGARAFSRAAGGLQASQAEHVLRVIGANAASAYGNAHGFAGIDSLAAFRSKVPIVDHDALRPWIDQIADGTANVLTCEPVLGLRRTAGHAGGVKDLPVTAGLLAELGAAVTPWFYDWLQHKPELWRRRFYWEIPARRPGPTATAGHVPYASFDPVDYVGSWSGRVMRRHLAVPVALGSIDDGARWRRNTLFHLLLAGDLATMIVRNPATAIELMNTLEAELPELLALLPVGRAKQIRDALDAAGSITAAAVWPRLRVLAMWRDGATAPLAAQVATRFPGVTVRTGPIESQECIITSPRWAQESGDPLAVTSHFFEFIDMEQPRRPPLLAHELQKGATYLPVVTTAGGLYRYRLQDAVMCTGHEGSVPLFKYVDKALPTTNLHGERLTPERLQRCLQECTAALGLSYNFALVAPLPRPNQGYCLFIDSAARPDELELLGAHLETALCRDYAYWYCRDQGQLQALRVIRVQNGWDSYKRALAEFDVLPWDIKPTTLDRRTIWPGVF